MREKSQAADSVAKLMLPLTLAQLLNIIEFLKCENETSNFSDRDGQLSCGNGLSLCGKNTSDSTTCLPGHVDRISPSIF